MTNWKEPLLITPRQYTCGHCQTYVSATFGYVYKGTGYSISLCPQCDRPTFFDDKKVLKIPGNIPGNYVGYLPADIQNLYLEARKSCGAGAYTASVLASRKLLMNISVSRGERENLKFIDYVNYLDNQHYIPPNAKGWVDHIRKKRNEATHEIALMSKADAEEFIEFSEMLLRFIYEFPARVPPPSKK